MLLKEGLNSLFRPFNPISLYSVFLLFSANYFIYLFTHIISPFISSLKAHSLNLVKILHFRIITLLSNEQAGNQKFPPTFIETSKWKKKLILLMSSFTNYLLQVSPNVIKIYNNI